MEKHKTRKHILWIAAGIVAVLMIVVIVCFLAFRIKTIEVEGNSRYSKEEIIDAIFKNRYDKYTLIFRMKNKFGKKEEIPFVETYDVEIKSPHKVKITVYEKEMVGCIEYMGNYMYFDKDGIVVESFSEHFKDIPLITGWQFDYMVLNSKLPTQNEEIFELILDLTQLLQKYSILVDKIYIDEQLQSTLYIEKVKVELGTNEQLNEKVADLNDIVPNLEGKEGTLDMKKYNEKRTGYTMKKKK